MLNDEYLWLESLETIGNICDEMTEHSFIAPTTEIFNVKLT